MKRFLFLWMLCISITSYAQTNTWTGAGANNNWNTVDNWSLNALPTATNDVVIPNGSAAILNVAVAIKSIDLQGNASLTITNSLSFTDSSSFGANTNIVFSNGNIRGGGTLNNYGTIDITTTAGKYIYDDTVLNNFGTINFMGTGSLYINYGTINNQASGIIDLQSEGDNFSYTSGPSHKLNNYGILKRTAATGISSIKVELHNDGGTLDVQSGELRLNNGLIKLTGGVYNVSADATLNWLYTVTCEGNLSGNLNGQINWVGTLSVPVAATFDFSGNTGVNWSNGSLRGSGVLTNNSKITMLTSIGKYIYDNSTLSNNGIINFESTGPLYINDGTLDNQEAGVIDLKSDGNYINYTSGSTHILNNYGLIKRSVTSGVSSIGLVLNNNNGTIAVDSGVLDFKGLTKYLSGGIYNVANGSSLLWNTQIICAQTLEGILDGEISWNGELNIPESTSATFNFTGATGVNWTYGSLKGGGNLVNNSEITLLATNGKYIQENSTLINHGAINIESTGPLYVNDGTVNNEASGIIDLKAAENYINFTSGAKHKLNNEGLIKTSVPSSTSNIAINLHNNNGTISVESGNLSFTSLSKYLNDGIYNVSVGASLKWDTQIVLSGSLIGVLDGELLWESEVNVPINTIANFDFTGATGVHWADGDIRGAGTLVNKSEITMLSTSGKYIYDNTILNNEGLIYFESTGPLYINDGTLNNQVNGIIDLKVEGAAITYTSGATHILNNYGLLKRTSSTGTATLSAVLNNVDGTISVESGILNFNTLTKNLTNGTYNVSSGSSLNWNTQIVCEGSLEGVLDGEILWNNEVNIQPSTTAIFNFTGNSGVHWNDGNLRGGGTLTNDAKITLLTTAGKYVYDDSILNNNASIYYESTGSLYINNGTINNLPSGIIDLKMDGNFLSFTTGSTHVFNNAGLLKKTVGTAASAINSSTTNSGIIDVQSGTINFASTPLFNNTIDGIIKGTGTINLPGAALLTNDGTHAPGASPGILTVVGNYKSSTSSVLDMELDGLLQGTEYDVLAITGTNVVFEGNVNITLGFDANVGDTFAIATVSGIIDTKNLVSPVYANYGCKQYTFNISYPNDKEVLLTISEKEDVLPPDVVTQDIAVQLDASGNASIIAAQIDNGSTDNCTLPENLIFDLDISNFTCANLGVNTVSLAVTDEAGNTASASAIVTVEDNMSPTVITQDITVSLDATGNASIAATEIDNGSSDNCSVASMSLDSTDFTCANLGANTVYLTVVDTNGNSASLSAIVTVEDNMSPTVITQDITVSLDATGNASIAVAEIDNGSSDNCSVASMSLDSTDFTCANLGANTVYLTVVDTSGNSASLSAIVTVEDNLTPEIICPEGFTQENDGPYTIPDYYNTGLITVSDNCSIASVVQTPAPGTILADGGHNISFVVTDSSGNTQTCMFELKVEDTSLSIDDFRLTEKDILLFPNPVKDKVTLSNTNHLKLVNAILMDVKGSIITTIDLRDVTDKKEISLEAYSQGMYFIKINSINGSIVKRLIKQ